MEDSCTSGCELEWAYLFMSNQSSHISAAIVQSIALSIKDFCIGYSIPPEQVKFNHYRSMLHDETLIRLQVLMSSNLSDSRSEGKLPATLWDWLKLYTGRFLGWAGIHPHYDIVDLQRTNTYNLCPHIQIPKDCLSHATWYMHQVFLLNGPDIKDLGPDLSKAANEIVQAALMDYPYQHTNGYISMELLKAVHHYRDIIKGRMD